MKLPVEVQFTRPLISVQDMVNFIDKGESYLKASQEKELSDEQQFEFLQGIILSPDYQREYRSKAKEESSIIESLIVGIPIPEVFLVRSTNEGIQLRHVMDGQHRLTAIYRYVKDKFPLTELELLDGYEEYKNKKFSQLSREAKIKILGSHLSVLEFEPFESDDMEIELFKRYNRNTKPLEKHEMSMATFYSKTSLYITNFLNRNMEKAEEKEEAEKIIEIYNITNDRKNKQRNHQELCIIFSILKNGPNLGYRDGVEIADKYLESCSKKYKAGKNEELNVMIEKFNGFNEFVLNLSKDVKYPFSTEIIRGEEKRSTKFHTGIAMILAVIYYYFEIDLSKDTLINEVRQIIMDSPLGDETYKASSTNMRNLMTYFCIKNKIFDKTYESLQYKNNISNELKETLNEKTSV